jgi:hypothetical protein
MLQAADKLYAAYSDDQLRIVGDFMTRMSLLIREQIAGVAVGTLARR